MSGNTEPDYSSQESRFYIALGHYMQTFALFEQNLGLCIRWIVNRKDVKIVHPFLERLSTKQKLDVLKELIFYKYGDENPQMISDFNQWFEDAAKTRASRNRYVHGVWRFIRQNRDAPIRFEPLSWSAGIGRPMQTRDEERDMDLADFEKIVEEMKSILGRFNELRDKYSP